MKARRAAVKRGINGPDDWQVFRSIKDALDKGLLEQNAKHHRRTTEKWNMEVVLYESKGR